MNVSVMVISFQTRKPINLTRKGIDKELAVTVENKCK
jgi:hypothetical protein